MEIDGDDPDDEPLGDLCAGQALRQQSQHLHLASSEPSGIAGGRLRSRT